MSALLLAAYLGAAVAYSGPVCERAEDTVRLVRAFAINAQVMSSRADILALAEREGVDCRMAYGLRGVFGGTVDAMAFTVGETRYEVLRIVVGPRDFYGWRRVEKPGSDA